MDRKTRKQLRKQMKREEQQKMLTEKFEREAKMGLMTLQKYTLPWEKLLFEIKLPQIQQEIDITWKRFDWLIDLKELITSLLLDTLSKSEEQSGRFFDCYTTSTDNLIRIFRTQMIELQDQYIKNFTTLVTRSKELDDRLQQTRNENETFLKTMAYQSEHKRNELGITRESIVLYMQKKFEEDHDKLTYPLNRKKQNLFSSLWKSTNDTLDKIEEQRATELKDYIRMSKKNTQISNIIEHQLLKINELSVAVRFLIQDYIKLKWKSGLVDSPTFYQESFSTMRRKFEDDMVNDKKKLQKLVAHSHHIILNIEAVKKKGLHIVALWNCCEKLETHREHTLRDKNATKDLFEGIYRKIAAAESSRTSLNEEKRILVEENQRIQRKLCDFLSRPSKKVKRPMDPKVGVNKIEGVMFVKNYEKHGYYGRD